MELTDFQKQVIEAMLAGKVKSIDDFVRAHCDLEQRQMPSGVGTYLVFEDALVGANSMILIPKDPEDAMSRTLAFVALCSKLESAGLIVTVPMDKRALPPIFRKGPPDMQQFQKLMTLLNERRAQEIVATNDLARFVQRGHLTEEEESRRIEEQDRKSAQKTTLVIGYGSLIVSIIIAVATSIWNSVTYSKDRTVVITNTNAFPSVQRVLIMNSDFELNQAPRTNPAAAKPGEAPQHRNVAESPAE